MGAECAGAAGHGAAGAPAAGAPLSPLLAAGTAGSGSGAGKRAQPAHAGLGYTMPNPVRELRASRKHRNYFACSTGTLGCGAGCEAGDCELRDSDGATNAHACQT